MDLVNYKTAQNADLSRISQINDHLDMDDDFTGFVEVIDSTLEIGAVGDAMLETGDEASEIAGFEQMKTWTVDGRIKTEVGTHISENHPDEYVYVIALPPFYLIKRKTPAAQV